MNLRGQWQSLVSVNGPVVEIDGGECAGETMNVNFPTF